MAKRPPRASKPTSDPDAVIAAVGPREPCPCGSGRRYKACHGQQAARAQTRLVARPFEGIAGEPDLIAMATLVPAATIGLRLADGTAITAATLLPMAWPALHRADGELMLGMQIAGGSGDPSRDMAAALQEAQGLPVGTPVLSVSRPGVGPRLQDLLDASAEPSVTMHDGFAFWLEGAAGEPSDEIASSLERADEAIVPTARLTGVQAAYWCRIGTKEHLRWVLPEAEEKLLDAFAQLSVADELGVGPGTKYIGSFRAHGLLVAVWDLAPGDEAADVEESALAFRTRLDAALEHAGELSAQERRARADLTGSQVTLR